jgi:hypothetical protein
VTRDRLERYPGETGSPPQGLRQRGQVAVIHRGPIHFRIKSFSASGPRLPSANSGLEGVRGRYLDSRVQIMWGRGEEA